MLQCKYFCNYSNWFSENSLVRYSLESYVDESNWEIKFSPAGLDDDDLISVWRNQLPGHAWCPLRQEDDHDGDDDVDDHDYLIRNHLSGHAWCPLRLETQLNRVVNLSCTGTPSFPNHGHVAALFMDIWFWCFLWIIPFGKLILKIYQARLIIQKLWNFPHMNDTWVCVCAEENPFLKVSHFVRRLSLFAQWSARSLGLSPPIINSMVYFVGRCVLCSCWCVRYWGWCIWHLGQWKCGKSRIVYFISVCLLSGTFTQSDSHPLSTQ